MPEDGDPAAVAGEVDVELSRQGVQRGKTGPGDGGEVVVFVVQADVIREQVKPAVVREGFRDRDERRGITGLDGGWVKDVVLGDEMSGAGVQRAREEGTRDEIGERVVAGVFDEENVEDELRGDVEEVESRERELIYHHWAERVKQDLKGAEEGFA